MLVRQRKTGTVAKPADVDPPAPPAVYAVPEGAVQASEQGFVTYVVDQGKAHLRPIEIGLRTGDGSVEILSGVKPKETVVIEGSDRLADGIDVQPLAAISAAAAPAPEPTR